MSALLIVGHGSRDEEGAEQFRAFVRRVADRAAGDGLADAVAGGFIELSTPPLKQAVAGLWEEGHRILTAVPLILLAAGHAKGDIPAALARERDRHPRLRTRLARPLGPHPTVLELLRQRLEAASEPGAEAGAGVTDAGDRVPETAARPDAVLLVGRGTTDPDANADLYRAARLLWETTRATGVRQVEPAFVSLAEPSVAQGLDRLRALGAQRVVVLPFFLFPGILPTRIHAQAGEWSRRHEEVAVTVADVIGDCDALADLVFERYLEGEGRGPAAPGMNCDACVYRIALPGFESRVGQTQHPHDHPDDPTHPHHHAHPGHRPHDQPHPDHAPAQDLPRSAAASAPTARLARHAAESPDSPPDGARGAVVG